jgi:hypothetical protein
MSAYQVMTADITAVPVSGSAAAATMRYACKKSVLTIGFVLCLSGLCVVVRVAF